MVETLAVPKPTSEAVKPAVVATPAPAQVITKPDVQAAPAPEQKLSETPKSAELLKRMADSKPAETPKLPEDAPVSTMESETDPKVKEKILNLEKHYNKKYMELAEKIRQTESERQSLNQWSPEKLDQILRNPEFVQAAQSRLQQQTASQAPSNWQGSQEEWSALTPSEKQHIQSLEMKVNDLLSQQDQMLTVREDELIKSRIPDYDPKVVDTLATQIESRQIPRGTLREMMWKAMNFDKAVERSYQFGREDRNGDIQGKMIASSPTIGSASTQSSEEVPVRAENESSQNWFRRVAQARLEQAKKSGTYIKK